MLAIVETLVAMGLSLWIAVHFGTVKHVVVGACIAPLLLLRTDASAVLGIRMYIGISRQLEDRFGNVAAGAWEAFAAVPIRFVATLVATARALGPTVRAAPENWRRIVVATDSSRPPQTLPTPDDPALVEEVPSPILPLEVYQLHKELGDRFWGYKYRFSRLSNSVQCWTLIIPFLSIPVILYRLSLKSTAIIWFPLLWALRQVGPKDAPLKARLELFEKSDFFRIVLVVSAAALLLFAGKLILWNELAQASSTWNESIGGRIAAIHVAPGLIEWWQMAVAINSLIAIGLWLYVRSWLRRDKVGVPWPETRVEPLLAWSLFVRRLLTTYTILCVGYLYVREAGTWQLPPLGGKLFPWM